MLQGTCNGQKTYAYDSVRIRSIGTFPLQINETNRVSAVYCPKEKILGML